MDKVGKKGGKGLLRSHAGHFLITESQMYDNETREIHNVSNTVFGRREKLGSL